VREPVAQSPHNSTIYYRVWSRSSLPGSWLRAKVPHHESLGLRVSCEDPRRERGGPSALSPLSFSSLSSPHTACTLVTRVSRIVKRGFGNQGKRAEHHNIANASGNAGLMVTPQMLSSIRLRRLRNEVFSLELTALRLVAFCLRR
jgi:hypothetical protein